MLFVYFSGSYLSALVHFASLYPESSVVGNAYTGGLSADNADFLQQTADDVIKSKVSQVV